MSSNNHLGVVALAYSFRTWETEAGELKGLGYKKKACAQKNSLFKMKNKRHKITYI